MQASGLPVPASPRAKAARIFFAAWKLPVW